MIILIILGLCLISGIVWYWFDEYSTGSILLAGFSGLFLAVSLIILFINPIMVNANIEGFKAIKYTIQTDRGNDNIENTALKMKIIDANQWLSETQYYNNSIFGLWIPDTIEELKFIQ